MKEYTAAIMLEELLAKLRGADKWPEIIATVTSASRQLARGKGKSYRRESCDVHFRYAPSNCGNQIGRFKVASVHPSTIWKPMTISKSSSTHVAPVDITATRIGSRSKQNGPSFFLLRLWES
jgi:hypothetical protein